MAATLMSAALLNLFLFLLSGCMLQTCPDMVIGNKTTAMSKETRVSVFVVLPCLLMPLVPVAVQLAASRLWASEVGLRVAVTIVGAGGYMSLVSYGGAVSPCATPGSFSVYMGFAATNLVIFEGLQQLIRTDMALGRMAIAEPVEEHAEEQLAEEV